MLVFGYMEEHALFFIVQDDNSIEKRTIDIVEKQLGNASGDQLYLIMESFGGDPFSAVAIMNILQNRFKKITSIVPSHSKSAGTLMVLGTDEIYMNDKSSLGPLDLPIEHPKDGSRISALDVQQTITSLSSLSESIADERYNFLRKDRKMSKKEAAQMALDCSVKLIEPIVSQIDPYHLQKANRELKIGFWYAIDLLVSRMMKDNLDQAIKTARSLVNDWPAHEYAIFQRDAKTMLKLDVKKLDTLPSWKNHLEVEYNDKYAGKSHCIVYKKFTTPLNNAGTATASAPKKVVKNTKAKK